MKRTVIILIITGMFVWAVYDLVSTNESKTAEDADIETLSEDESSKEDNENTTEENEVKEDKEVNNDDSGETGLERGNFAPDFELETLDGERMKLSDFRGKRVMLNFWATWCPPCRAEIPDMQRFYEDKDVVILAVDLTSTETDLDNIPEFVEEFGVTFRILLDENDRVATLYEIQPIPTSYLIDSEGIVHNMAVGALNYDMMVQEFEKMD